MSFPNGIADRRSLVRDDSSCATAARGSVPTKQIGTVPVLHHNNSFLETKVGQRLSVEVLQTAWAILLRTYLFEDVITYAYMTASDAGTSNLGPKQGFLVDVAKASLYQYRSLAERQTGEYGPDSIQPLTLRDVEDNHINMAMSLFTYASPNSMPPSGTQSSGHLYQYGGTLYEVSHYLERS